jgi:hypothetical protein
MWKISVKPCVVSAEQLVMARSIATHAGLGGWSILTVGEGTGLFVFSIYLSIYLSSLRSRIARKQISWDLREAKTVAWDGRGFYHLITSELWTHTHWHRTHILVYSKEMLGWVVTCVGWWRVGIDPWQCSGSTSAHCPCSLIFAYIHLHPHTTAATCFPEC